MGTMIPFCTAQIPRDEKTLLLVMGLGLAMFYGSMDILLYCALQSTTLATQETGSGTKTHGYSPFRPLTMKLLSIDHTSHYVIKPSSEYFNQITHFSSIFYFITPNMISFTHVLVGILAGKCISSDSLHDRRIGALLFEFRTWLDGLDGVVYRARIGETSYHSHRNSIGFVIDMVCDIIGGAAVCLGTLFYLFKAFDRKQQEALPTWSKSASNGTGNHANNNATVPSRKLIFWKCLCFGLLVAVASKAWDMFVDEMEKLYEKPMNAPHLTAAQTSALHSLTTWCILWLWRCLAGQQFLQYLMVAIVIDKVWEFLNIVQYLGHVVVICLSAISFIYIQHMKSLLGI